MIDDTAVTRRLNLMQLLRARRRGATVREIAGEMQVSERTIRRDLAFLCKINYPIEEAVGDRGRKAWRHIGNGNLLPLTNRHHSQTLSHQRDGSLLARFPLSSTVEIKSWVLGFGANAIVLEPEVLRIEIARDLEHLLSAHYASSLKP
jgi:predicted DNA-binding transcriptional regulator YafY